MTNNSAPTLTRLVVGDPGYTAMQALEAAPGTCLHITAGTLPDNEAAAAITVNLHPFPMLDLLHAENMREHVASLETAGVDTLELVMPADWRWGFDPGDPSFRISRKPYGRLVSGEATIAATARLILVEIAAGQAFHFLTLER